MTVFELKARRKLLNLCMIMAGCATGESIQVGLNNNDQVWGAENKQVIAALGTRAYKATKKEAIRALSIALTDIGFIIQNADTETGIVFATANAPTPLSQEEWARVVDQELPALRSRMASSAGPLAAAFTFMRADHYEVHINAIVIDRPGGVQLNGRFRLKYIGPTVGWRHGTEAPPEAVKLGLKKSKEAFEKNFVRAAAYLEIITKHSPS